MRTTIDRWSRWAVLVVLVLLETGAWAQHVAKETARRLVASARAHFNLAEYTEALADFREAYRLQPKAALLFNIGQCQRLLHQYPEAVRSYRAFLNESSDGPALDRAQAERLIAEAEKAADAPPPWSLASIGGTVAAPASTSNARANDLRRSEPPAVEPRRSEPPAVEPRRSEPRAVEPVAPAAAATTPTDGGATTAPRRPWYKNPTSLSLSLGGTVTLGVGGALVGIASRFGDQAGHATRLSDVSRFHASDLEFQRAGWPLVGIGAAALAAGAVLLVLDWKGALK
jgi:hypothetical protein